MSGRHSGYLPAVDGLRAIAVIAVLVNHMAAAVLPSGYLGVDIFFVISGFVVTQSLLARPAEPLGRLLIEFYARRMRRLLPALLLVVIVGALSIRLFDPNPVASLVTGALALIGASNLFLYSEAIDYFGGSAALNIFTHTWSLGVEEQFYLVHPLLIGLTARAGVRLRIGIFAALVLISGLAFVVIAQINLPAAYFLMPFRLWELGLGCLAALLIAGGEPANLQTAAPQKRLGARSLWGARSLQPAKPFRAGKVRVALFESHQRDVPKSSFLLRHLHRRGTAWGLTSPKASTAAKKKS
jgi:peptidoglycan/LPS O-acetylase OafA/YrhL